MTRTSILKAVSFTTVAALMTLPLAASVASPVSLTLASVDKARRGEPATIVAIIVSGEDMPQATFEVPQQPQWHLLDGATRWVGSLHKDERLELKFRVMPLTDAPDPLLGAVTPLNQRAMIASLDARRMNGESPEREIVDAEPQPELPPAAEMEAARQRALASPAAVKQADSRSAAVQLTVTGRFVYPDENNVDRPLRHAKVQLINRAMNVFDPIEQVCKTGSTDDDGNYSLSGSCDDVINGPDVAVRVVLDNDAVRVKPDGVLHPLDDATYTFQVNSTVDFGGGSIGLGTRHITTNTGAFQLHNLITRAREFMSSEAGETVPKVTMIFPAPLTITMRVGVAGVNLNEIRIKGDLPFSADAVAFHEYGHHILFNLSEFPFPDYNNGQCDTVAVTLPFVDIIEPGHCFWKPEKDVISWSEGWPDYFAAMVFAKHHTEDGLTAPAFYKTQIETRPDFTAPDQFEFLGQEDHVEGFIAAILWDLTDATNDDQEAPGAGQRDNVNLTFANIWDVIKNFDPDSSDLFHNHPVSIHEFWSGMKSRLPNQINLVSEVYREHRIMKPLPDLQVTALQNPPTAIPLGASFSVSNTVTNVNSDDDEVAVSASTVRFRLIGGGAGRIKTIVALTTRQVAGNLGIGASSTTITNLTVPSNMQPGVYTLQVCADVNGNVPERDETNNCRLSTGTVNVE